MKKLIESGSPLPLYHTPPEVMNHIFKAKRKQLEAENNRLKAKIAEIEKYIEVMNVKD